MNKLHMNNVAAFPFMLRGWRILITFYQFRKVVQFNYFIDGYYHVCDLHQVQDQVHYQVHG